MGIQMYRGGEFQEISGRLGREIAGVVEAPGTCCISKEVQLGPSTDTAPIT